MVRLGTRCFAAACVIVSCLLLDVSFVTAQTYDIAVTMRYPDGGKASPQPTGLFVDSRTGDIYVADASTARVAIYDSQRRFNFEFSTRDRLSAPQQITVDSLGRIFVLGDTRMHTLAVFDYNGDFLNYVDLVANGDTLKPSGLAMDGHDNLYALCAEPARVYVFNTSGDFLRDFVILTEADEETRNTEMLGNFAIYGNQMLFSLPMIGQAASVGFDGKLIRIFGVPGGGTTELSFPIACCVNTAGEYVVLDKHRHLLQYFNSEGQFVREVGGPGISEGWFFHPTVLACCADGALIVGQIYNNVIQSVVFRDAPIVTGL